MVRNRHFRQVRKPLHKALINLFFPPPEKRAGCGKRPTHSQCPPVCQPYQASQCRCARQFCNGLPAIRARILRVRTGPARTAKTPAFSRFCPDQTGNIPGCENTIMRQALQVGANRQPARFIQRQAAVFQPVWRACLSNQKTMRLYLLAICQRDAGAGNRLCRTVVQIKMDPSFLQRLGNQAAGPFRQGGRSLCDRLIR